MKRGDGLRPWHLQLSAAGAVFALIWLALIGAFFGFDWWMLVGFIGAPLSLVHDAYLWRRRFVKPPPRHLG